MRPVLERSSVLCALLLAAPAGVAHHSAATFDTSTRVTVTGTVVSFEWKNPHVELRVESTVDSAEHLVWQIEAHPPAVLKRLGWSSHSFRPGDAVVATGNPDRNPARHVLRLYEVRREDGMQLVSDFLPSAPREEVTEPRAANGLAGTWLTFLDLELNASFTASGSGTLPLTARGVAALATHEPAAVRGEDCTPQSAPLAMLFPDVKRIDVERDAIRIRTAHESIERSAHLGVASPTDPTRSLQGRSSGRWEGQVLVVETQGFADHPMGNAYGLPSGAQKHLVERFELNSDGTSLTYRFELEDPEYLTSPITGEAQWEYRPDLALLPEVCDSESAGRFLSD